MRSKILVVITTVLLFGVGFAVYAYNSTQSITETVAASCCSCCGDSCPMKAKDAKTTAAEASHECCCKGDGASCPMKSKDAKSGDKMAMAGDGKHSCPMMSGEAAHKMEPGMKHDMKMAKGESCPMMKDGKSAKMDEMHKGMPGMDHSKSGHSCPCCSHNKDKKVTTEEGAI